MKKIVVILMCLIVYAVQGQKEKGLNIPISKSNFITNVSKNVRVVERQNLVLNYSVSITKSFIVSYTNFNNNVKKKLRHILQNSEKKYVNNPIITFVKYLYPLNMRLKPDGSSSGNHLNLPPANTGNKSTTNETGLDSILFILWMFLFII